VPVREIARLLGVAERTLYKYVRKGGWRRRHANPAGDAAIAAANRGRRHAPARPAPVRGAGGRFVRRADAEKPFARGLKALDPGGAEEALARCAHAAALAQAALAEARDLRIALSDVRTLVALVRLVRELVAIEAAHALAGDGPASAARADDAREAARLRHELARRIEALVRSRPASDG
jgi:hypothetical protein